MAAAGKVCTGFSLPYVAKYAMSGTTVVYSLGQKLARGVEVSMDITTADNTQFWADNVACEEVGGKFQEGTLTLTVDGLLEASEKLIQGISTSSITVGTATITVYNYDSDQNIPYVGVGYIARYLSDGVTSYVPFIVPKAKFNTPAHNAATESDGEIDFQTQELTASIFRTDEAKGPWLKMMEGQSSEADAEKIIKSVFGITP